MSRKDRHIRLCVVLLVLNLVFIWGNSLLPGEASGRLSDWVRELLMCLLPDGRLDQTDSGGLLRKIAHFMEFASLGILLTGLHGLLDKHWSGALGWGIAAACLDETIQIFVPGRGPGLRDVGIDACGVAVGIIVLHSGYRLWKRKQSLLYGGKQQ